MAHRNIVATGIMLPFCSIPMEIISRLGSDDNPVRYTRIDPKHTLMDQFAAKGGRDYAGRIPYPDGKTEILTEGIERLIKDPVLFAVQDPDYCEFIIKITHTDWTQVP